MKSFQFFLFVGSLFAATSTFISCDNGFKNVDQKFTLKSFSHHQSLQGSKLNLGTLLAPIEIFFHDSLLFVTADGLDKNVSIFNRSQNFLPVGSIVPRGEGPDELLSVASMTFDADGTFWAHDIVGARMKKFQLVKNMDSIVAVAKGHVSLKWPVLNAFRLKSGVIGTTTHEIDPLRRFYVYDSLGKKKGEIGDYPTYEREIPSTAMVEVFNGRVNVHPAKDKFVLSYEFTDLVEIYDLDFNLIKRVQGPNDFIPEFDLKQRGNSTVMMRRFDKTKFAYQNGVSNDSLIFLLYAKGETVSKEDNQELAAHFTTIIALDWAGTPISIYKLDHPVICICVGWKNRIIYGLNRIESEVYAFPF